MRIGLELRLAAFLFCAVLILFIAVLRKPTASKKMDTGTVVLQTPAPRSDNLSTEPPQLTESLAQNQNDLKSQFLNSLREQYAERQRQKYVEGERFWREQLQKYPNNFITVRNAARFFIRGNLYLGIDTFNYGKSLDDPNNAAVWDRALGNALWLLAMQHGDASLAKEALKSFEDAYAEERSDIGRSCSPIWPRLHWQQVKSIKPVDYANQMLSSTAYPSKGVDGDMIYNGNYVLGMAAIDEGNIGAAAEYLLVSGDTPGSPVLSSFGPNMRLAKELLERGQRDTVLAFLKKCSRFWNGKTSPCRQWIREMEEGQTPDFGRNLMY